MDGFKYKKGFKLFLEEVQNINSDKEVKLKDYKDKLDKYNAEKSKLQSIVNTKPQESWEEEATKVINGNPYLGIQWKLDKITHTVKQNEESIKRGELSQEESNKVKETIKEDQNELNNIKQELAKKIKDDLTNIQTM
jgi:hypothetical protein